jgi:hypothetical protein
MQSTLKRLAVVAALGTMGILAPAAGASAAVTPAAPANFGLPGVGLPAAGLGLPAAGLGLPAAGLGLPAAGLGLPAAGLGLPAGGLGRGLPLSFVGPSVGQVAAVIGPTVITTAPSTFTNTNLQTAAGSNLTGGQAGP